ncbi:hypothetical protein WICPIJ_003614 [Wickerhamomyces pijperi]|uniref:Secreted protein n=1 Tax=Wickerhamomyces pijperi TaxID=599730 RepID=A0A9P8Q992_WICPI|nr:hypothetical protein WICPIJ_003614 [Wickerhamomyces pijperi]
MKKNRVLWYLVVSAADVFAGSGLRFAAHGAEAVAHVQVELHASLSVSVGTEYEDSCNLVATSEVLAYNSAHPYEPESVVVVSVAVRQTSTHPSN